MNARAENVTACDCGAERRRSWRIRAVRADALVSQDTIEIQVDCPLNTREAMDLSLSLQALAIETAHRNIARRERIEDNMRKAMRRGVKTKGEEDKLPWE